MIIKMNKNCEENFLTCNQSKISKKKTDLKLNSY